MMKRFSVITLSVVAAASLVFAQDQSNGGWRRLGGGSPSNGPQSEPQNEPRNDPPNDPPNYAVPPQLTIKAGTFVTVRVDQPLSSDHNQAGDAFSATLVQPVVVDGVVVAQRGQTIGGRVSEAQKAGRVEGVARLGVELTELTLVDGQQVPIHTQLISRRGPTSVGQDAGTIAGTTGLGAAIGAAAGWGKGAAIGAGAGAAAGVIGVLLTRGHPSVIYPESVLTFRIEAPVSFSTERAPQAFRYVDPNDYPRQTGVQVSRPPSPPPPYYYGPGYYPPYYYGYGYGPGFGFYYGPRFFYGYGYHRFRR
jgi:hypothetical protein